MKHIAKKTASQLAMLGLAGLLQNIQTCGVEFMEFPGVSKKENVEIPVQSGKPKNFRDFFSQ